MQNNSGDMRTGWGEKSELGAGENFFEQHGMMPSSDPQRVGNKVINSVGQEKMACPSGENALKAENMIVPNDPALIKSEEVSEQNNERIAMPERSFSNGVNFTAADGKITESQIRKLKEDPAAAYEELQSDREEYQNKSFGRTFGEQK